MDSSKRIEQLKILNPGLPLYETGDGEFRRYGTAAAGLDVTPLLEYARALPLPADGVEYIRSIPALENNALSGEISSRYFSENPLQVGICHGHNSMLNAVEWHPSSELLAAATELLLLLGNVGDIREGRYDSSLIRGFYVREGEALVLYHTTLHFAPVSAGPEGFRALIILPEMTNAPLDEVIPIPGSDELLFAVNKWMIAHPESPQALRGAHAGITGDNISVKIS